ncbi:hypothetical protein AGDE_09136 [Angomonas deanei]|nr:hypothetical protein AGDE_09136 [Angomonas deanei]|eukprot:EPY31273.1 hypothetical protein AGDE_09136 [Angomonas deanei]
MLPVGETTDGAVQSLNSRYTSSAGLPHILSSQRGDVTSLEYKTALVEELEERRLARQKRMFEDMLVFEGGALSDHETLGHKMIYRDFVQFSLYHMKWGYYPKLFRKYRKLMTTGYFDPIPYGSLRSQHDYERYITKIHEQTPSFVTPTQMFQPFYGWVLGDYLVSTYRSKFDPREPLVVYDVGAGTGALALSVLNYLAEQYPAVYERIEYHVIEQSPYLIQSLRNKLIHHYHRVKIHHVSVLNWRQVEMRRCVVLGIELLSGLPHDCILWDKEGVCSEQWLLFRQIDNLSTAMEHYEPLRDPLLLRYLRYLNWMQEETYHHLKVLCLTDGRETLDKPVRGGLSPKVGDNFIQVTYKMFYIHSPFHTAFIPTTQMLFFEVLAQYFPRHHLFLADWNSVRQGIPGYNGPVVQVKLRVAKELYLRRPVDTFHTNAGMVDVCYPTDFDHLGIVYRNICGKEKRCPP